MLYDFTIAPLQNLKKVDFSRKVCKKVDRSLMPSYDIIIMDTENTERPPQGHPCGGFSIGGNMGYRKVTYTEQLWYIIKYKLQQVFRRRK